MTGRVRELLSPNQKLEVLSRSLSRDVLKLQAAIIKENKHDIGAHIEALSERASALADLLHDQRILREESPS